MSLGRCFAGHSLPHKLDMTKKYGFHGIEVFYEDLVDLTHSMPGGASHSNQLAAARIFRNLCDARGLEIICIQPFLHFGGLVDREEQRRQVEEVRHWIQLAHLLGTDLIVFPASFLPAEQVTEDIDLIASDFTEVADIGLQASPVIRFAYESLCWATRTDTWESGWHVVQRVNRSNFGVCLDTFNIMGRIYADPASETGCTSNSDQVVFSSLQTLLSSLDVKKLFCLQVADGERLSSPLNEHHSYYNAEQPTRMSWSRNCRLFYGEASEGAYLPVKALLATVVRGLGYQGYLSFEVFNRRLTETDKNVPEEMARRAAVSFEKMVRDVPLQVASPSSQAETPSNHSRVSAML